MKMVPLTATIDEVQTSCLVRPKDFLISDKRGAMANQTQNAIKKDHQQQ
jgi:hypothetical protein